MEVSLPAKSAIEVEVIRKAIWRFLPLLMLASFIAFVDRVNSGFAALQMNHDIGLTQAAFGLRAGIFYISYVLCEVPSNLAGFVDSFLIGYIQGATGSYALALLPLVLIAVVGCASVLRLGSGQPVSTNAAAPSLH